MNDKANDVLINLINRAASGMDSAIDFSKAQLPEVIHQLMVWKAASYSLRITVSFLLLIGFVMAFKKGLALLSADTNSGPGFALLLTSGLASLFSLIYLTNSVGHALQLWLAPKVWLIEYAAQLMK
ncbi:Uncharacterised protein [Yersinia aldovae]|uniref:hypothetical protein n=1 Tax=Yersinia aldovae TaxID=29483 RepID=UPI0005E18FD0|nr:hypothetical protein [Yersinia aldovae]CNK19655.1 Uncharacterised protein [Yersinia aldovae]